MELIKKEEKQNSIDAKYIQLITSPSTAEICYINVFLGAFFKIFETNYM